MGRDKISSGTKRLEKIKRNNITIDLNILPIPHNTETVRVAYRSECTHKRKKQVILLMITDGKKWHYLAVTNLFALLKWKSSNHDGDFYCLNCFNSYTIKNKLEEHEEIDNNHDSCHIEMPKCFDRILKYNYGEKSLNAPFAIYLDLEFLLKKEQSSDNNINNNNNNNNNKNDLEKSYSEKKAKNEPGWALFTKGSFDEKENKLDYYRRKDDEQETCHICEGKLGMDKND